MVGRTLGVVALLAVAGCGGDACERLWYADRDGDGHGDRRDPRRACEAPRAHVAVPDDCDDGEPSVHPGALEACDGIDQDCDGVIDPDARTWYADADHDGYGTQLLTSTGCEAPEGFTDTPGDCDDASAAIHPNAAAELCDGRDQDCDGFVDEGAPGIVVWGPDADFDGQGDALLAELLCAPPSGWVPNAYDCDDNDPTIGLMFEEVCDLDDDDCDGQIDEIDDVIDPTTWYFDGDNDGYGVESDSVRSCRAPMRYTDVVGDCDDDDDRVHPAASEVCNAAVDDDCDGLADDQDPTLDPATLTTGWLDLDEDGAGDPGLPELACALGPLVVGNDDDCDDLDPWVGTDFWLEDADGDGVGAGTAVAGALCAPPGLGFVNAAAGGDCDEADPLVRPRVPDPCGDGVDQDCTGLDPACRPAVSGLLSLEDASRAWVSGAGAVDALGASFGEPADLDADGLLDVAIGAPGAGEVRIVLGPLPEVPGAISRSRSVFAAGIGGVVAVAPDVTGDGRAELLLGAPDAGAGAVYLLDDGGRLGTVAGARATITGTAVGERVGSALAVLDDRDGDGFGEVAVGGPDVVLGLGRVSVFGLEVVGPVSMTLADLEVTGIGSFGVGIAPALDADGDGLQELAIAAPAATDGGPNAGAVHLVPMNATGVRAVSTIESARLTGASGSRLGSALTAGGDLDGDGGDDFAAAAPDDGAAGVGAGRVFVFADPVGTSDAAAAALFLVSGDGAGAGLAQALAIGDLDGDALDDLLLGVSGADLTGVDAGAVYAFFGPLAGAAAAAEADAILYGAAGEQAGAALQVGDSDGDGVDDLWVGMPTGAGAARWVPGP